MTKRGRAIGFGYKIKGERYWLSNKEGEICIISNKGIVMNIAGIF